ncbi:TraR/DksA C4-type zinc finger protein [Streptomyces cyanogenus]|uniref:RNA polymerase-binding transcription factor DksA n=1 Tax=Streptomyces cyanogenus TaxID=80860 RepID=A0ABX7U0N1_STRCY|nr:TraR/DksA C4-type zinc finger protein [Streptomyces cyanogenus]QTE02578.1 RNA polymerase-binding transcription factor DksA [Streptomyces cyanogenus]
MSLDITRTAPHPDEARRRLEHARTSRLAQLRALTEGVQSADDHLLAEQKTAMERVVEEIEEAFARIDAGTYGTCLACARPIPAERLEILPYTRHCVTCRRRTA